MQMLIGRLVLALVAVGAVVQGVILVAALTGFTLPEEVMEPVPEPTPTIVYVPRPAPPEGLGPGPDEQPSAEPSVGPTVGPTPTPVPPIIIEVPVYIPVPAPTPAPPIPLPSVCIFPGEGVPVLENVCPPGRP